MTGELKRKLDIAANASIDLVALNNQVVKMRPVVKRSKLYVINKLTKKIKKFRRKKGTDKQKEQNFSKANNLVEEIKVIKVLKPDYISKYALGTAEKFEKIICQQNLDMERRALARLAEHQFIQEVVKKFRDEHDDWKELTAYLMTKHTSREFKKKKPAQKLAKVATNVKATEKIVETYLGDKLKNTVEAVNTPLEGNLAESKQESASEERDLTPCSREKKVNSSKKTSKIGFATNNRYKDTDESESGSSDGKSSDSDVEKSDNLKVRTQGSRSNDNTGKFNTVEDRNDSSDDEDDYAEESDEASDSDDHSTSKEEEEEEEISNESSEDEEFDKRQKSSEHLLLRTSSGSESESELAEKLNKSERTKMKPKSKNTIKEKLKQKSKKNVKKEPLTKNIEKISGEMIVKKLNLEEWTEESIETESNNTVPDFLVQTASQRSKSKVKDPFFCTSDDDEDVKSNSDVKSDNDNSDDDEIRQNKLDTESGQLTGISGLSTTFLGSLNSARMMKCDDPKFRSNEDWKKVRQEKKSKTFLVRGRGRGRGRIDRAEQGDGHSSIHRGRSGRGGPGTGGPGRGGPGGEDARGRRNKFINQDSGGLGMKHAESKSSPEGKLLQPSYLSQRTTAAAKSPEKKSLRPSYAEQSKTKPSNTSGEKLLCPTYLTQDKTKPAKSTEEKLHPSWQASKKRKEQQTSIQQFQGKRIKFD